MRAQLLGWVAFLAVVVGDSDDVEDVDMASGRRNIRARKPGGGRYGSALAAIGVCSEDDVEDVDFAGAVRLPSEINFAEGWRFHPVVGIPRETSPVRSHTRMYT
jgi:hypothetical protein